jgi:DNA repair photolyase
MGEERGRVRGRGAAENPPNRFERLVVLRDAEATADDPDPRTEFFRDASRSVLAHNDSPDVGFRFSVNPYRGCEHGCSYCVDGDTRVLMADGSTKPIAEIVVGDEIYGTVRTGWYRRYTRTRVLVHWSTVKPAYRILLQDGTELIASGDHRFLTERGWKHVTGGGCGCGRRPHLTPNNSLMGIGRFAMPPERDLDYRTGYLCGLIRGDGLLASYEYPRAGRRHGNQHQFRLALIDDEALRRAEEYLSSFGVATRRCRYPHGEGRWMNAIRSQARRHVETIREIVAWPSAPSIGWQKGLLAGIFDAEGSYSGGCLRVSNTDGVIIGHTRQALAGLGFDVLVEVSTERRKRPMQGVRIRGGLKEHLRFLHTVDPAIIRKRSLEGQAVKSSARLGIVSVEPLGVEIPLFDITTGTGDFIANGVVSHNCYARPTHEYLGFSAGLDFETRILVKEEAPALLRRALLSPRWEPAPIALSGVTDPYQPVERRLRLTRRCLEVLRDFRNPVGIVTKSHLVTRDADVLGELAEHGAAMVFLSITTLDERLQRALEPRAAAPRRRLAALAALSAAGIPVGVMVAPVVPGLTDHELPRILEAAAGAGARSAGFVPLRLPHGVKELFEAWLEAHVPERKEKVLNRVREMRGGKLNDSRFGTRMRGEGVYADQLRALFHAVCRKTGLNREEVRLSTAAFRRPPAEGKGQMDLFG